MTSPPNIRVFVGKLYNFQSFVDNRPTADIIATSWRRRGYYVRIIKWNIPTCNCGYAIYSRKR